MLCRFQFPDCCVTLFVLFHSCACIPSCSHDHACELLLGGMQGLAIRRSTLKAIGGVPLLPLMEVYQIMHIILLLNAYF